MIEPTDSQFVTELAMLEAKAFYEIVDTDIRTKPGETNAEGELILADGYRDALRSPQLCDRWFQALVRMKKSVEMTIAAKTSDDKAVRADLEGRGDLKRASVERIKYLKWKSGAIRFLTGVEETLIEANFYRRHLYGLAIDSRITEERDLLSHQVRSLRRAIRHHRDAILADGDEPDGIDEDLYAALDA